MRQFSPNLIQSLYRSIRHAHNQGNTCILSDKSKYQYKRELTIFKWPAARVSPVEVAVLSDPDVLTISCYQQQVKESQQSHQQANEHQLSE